ncbi:MAG: hypothetical protein L3J56_05040 [Bacteroidales bacterium]|nr:hypothetical protein [Bacteroidales bacterium]
MDYDGFEIINVAGKIYKYPMGWDKFKKQFLEYFPGKEEIFGNYYYLVNKAIDAQALYSLNHPEGNGDTELLMSSAYEVIKNISHDVDIQNYLAALNFDYVGEKEKTPFYVHALVTNYFVKSSYRVVGESDQLSKSLANSIEKMGGKVINKQKVVKFHYEDDKISAAETHTGDVYFADNFISNIHPANTMDLIEEGKIKKRFRRRMKNMENTISSFTVHLKLKEGFLKYRNYNYQYFKQNDVWYPSYYDEAKWPEHFFFHTPPLTQNDDCSTCVQIMTAMKYEEVKQWEKSTKRSRDPEYHVWKEKKAFTKDKK